MKQSLFILVVEPNPDQQLLIEYSLRVSIPQAEPVFTETAEEALRYLHQCVSSKKPCPKLILLNIHQSQQESGWQLLKDLRTNYSRLPILIFSIYHEPDFVKQAYELGAHSFIAKPHNLEGWEIQFKLLSIYWLSIVTLPPSY